MKQRHPQPASVLVCTVGTSMLSNPENKPIGNDSDRLYEKISALDSDNRACGAEINSCHSMICEGVARNDCTIVFIHSATPDARRVAEVLKRFFDTRKHPVKIVEVADLQDEDPERFRAAGLRNLANEISRVLQDNGLEQCAINATGGYKAQIAVAVLIGQSLHVPVYYLHEKFSSIISLPPMPVAPDVDLWYRHNRLFFPLSHSRELPASHLEYQPEAELDGLVEPVTIDGVDYIALTATGIAFHGAVMRRLGNAPVPLPRAARPEERKAPKFKEGEAHLAKYRPEIERWCKDLADAVPQVKQCIMTYYNPDLPRKNTFRLADDKIEGLYSDGSFTAKFDVLTTATRPEERKAVMAKLNEWASAQ